MNIFERMSQLDRRWVYLVLALVVVLTLLAKFKPAIMVTPEVASIYDFVEETKPDEIIHMALDYDPGSLAENHPMAFAIMEQALAKDINLIITALSPNGPGMVEAAMLDIIDSVKLHYGKDVVYGEDVVFLGYRPYPAIVIMGMGINYRNPFPNDYYNTPLDSLPMMVGVKNFDNVEGVILITGTSGIDMWIAYANGLYNVPLACGVTGVMAADYYPYLRSGQIFGLMGGMLGAAEYEKLVGRPADAHEAMKVHVWAHIFIILFILVGNIGYFISRRKGGMKI